MNPVLQNIVAFVLIIVSVVTAVYFLFLRQQGQYIPQSWADVGCIHLVYVKKDNLQPHIQQGVILSLNQCIKNKKVLNKNDIVIFLQNDKKVIGIIEDSRNEFNKTYYSVNIGENESSQILSDDILGYSSF